LDRAFSILPIIFYLASKPGGHGARATFSQIAYCAAFPIWVRRETALSGKEPTDTLLNQPDQILINQGETAGDLDSA